MLMIEDECEVCLEPKNKTDISINQAANEHCVSIDTVRRAIHNGQINGVYKVKRKMVYNIFSRAIPPINYGELEKQMIIQFR